MGGFMTVRAVRGAVQVDSADRDAILEATAELVTEVMSRNDLTTDDVISVLFTATPDLTAEFPALAARKMGFHDVPLICAAEIAVPGAMPRVVRLLAHIETDRPRSAIQHVYLRGDAPPGRLVGPPGPRSPGPCPGWCGCGRTSRPTGRDPRSSTSTCAAPPRS